MSENPRVTGFFDQATNTVSYLVSDLDTKRAAIIDSILDYDAAGGRTSTESADRLLAAVREQGVKVDWILETHAHADHLTAAAYLRDKLGAPIAIGAEITQVQSYFGALFNNAGSMAPGGGDFQHLFRDDEVFAIGNVAARAIATPGHTSACMTYLIGNAAFVGDTLFMPDYGTARCDFPGGDAATLYRSIKRILALPDDTRIFVCHDYAPSERPIQWESSVKAEREENVHMKPGVSEADFVAMRTARDRTLALPALILPSVQVNLRAGRFPAAENNGVSYVKIPLNRM
jgi:glyoxylase-like metal-dependent hydrolase (beta-lactamase superfamily II)